MSDRASKGYYQIIRLTLFSHAGKEYNFDKNFEVLYYNESIDQKFSDGHVSFLDSHDIIVNNSIVGGERLLFEYKITSESNVISKNFIVCSILTEGGNSGRNVQTLNFVSEELIINNNISISRSYKDKTANQIVADLFSEVNKRNVKLITEKTKGSHHIIVPNYKPFFGIDLVSIHAKTPSYKSSSFYFFENSYGYNFLSIEGMMEKEAIAKFYKNNQKLDTGIREKTGSLLSITQLSSNPSIIESMEMGMFGNKCVTYDSISKSYREIEFNYQKNYKELKHLNEFPVHFKEIQTNSPEQSIGFFPSNSLRKKGNYYSSKTDSMSHSNDIEDVIPYNKCFMSKLFAKEYEIALKGDDVSSLWESKQKLFTVGQVIEMEQKTKSMDDDDANKEHTYFNGKYLIFKCSHTFGKEGYVVKARVCSDSNIAAHNRK